MKNMEAPSIGRIWWEGLSLIGGFCVIFLGALSGTLKLVSLVNIVQSLRASVFTHIPLVASRESQTKRSYISLNLSLLLRESLLSSENNEQKPLHKQT